MLGARRELDLAGYVPIDAGPALLAFARTDGAGEPVLVTIVPRGTRRGVVELPPGQWGHVLLDGAAAVEGSLAVDDPLAAFPAIVLRRA